MTGDDVMKDEWKCVIPWEGGLLCVCCVWGGGGGGLLSYDQVWILFSSLERHLSIRMMTLQKHAVGNSGDRSTD